MEKEGESYGMIPLDLCVHILSVESMSSDVQEKQTYIIEPQLSHQSLRDPMKKSSSLALVCLLLSSIALVSVIPSDDSNGGNDHDSQTRMIPRELAHHSSCSSCPDKAVGALKKAKRGTSQVLSEARESLGEFIEKTLVERDPVHAAGAGMETASTLGKDVLSNATKAGAEAAMDQEAVTQVIKILSSRMIQTAPSMDLLEIMYSVPEYQVTSEESDSFIGRTQT